MIVRGIRQQDGGREVWVMNGVRIVLGLQTERTTGTINSPMFPLHILREIVGCIELDTW